MRKKVVLDVIELIWPETLTENRFFISEAASGPTNLYHNKNTCKIIMRLCANVHAATSTQRSPHTLSEVCLSWLRAVTSHTSVLVPFVKYAFGISGSLSRNLLCWCFLLRLQFHFTATVWGKVRNYSWILLSQRQWRHSFNLKTHVLGHESVNKYVHRGVYVWSCDINRWTFGTPPPPSLKKETKTTA